MVSAPEKAKPLAVGRYVLFQELARGSMATVHLGRLRGSGAFARTVAIKRFDPAWAEDGEFVARFIDQARSVARVLSPNVVPVLDVTATDGELLLVMDYVHGESLSRLLRLSARAGIPMSRRVLATIVIGVLHGLDAAHTVAGGAEDGEPVVHRDLSAQKVLLAADGQARVLFGIARAALRAKGPSAPALNRARLGYTSPEQLTGGAVDHRADIYSAGVLLWEGLTGRRLFGGKGTPDVDLIVSRVLSGAIDPPSKLVPSTPPALDAIVLKALARAPGDRYASAREMAAALEPAIFPASSRQVGEWVTRAAGEVLEERAAELHAIERVALPGPRDPLDLPTIPPHRLLDHGEVGNSLPAPDIRDALSRPAAKLDADSWIAPPESKPEEAILSKPLPLPPPLPRRATVPRPASAAAPPSLGPERAVGKPVAEPAHPRPTLPVPGALAHEGALDAPPAPVQETASPSAPSALQGPPAEAFVAPSVVSFERPPSSRAPDVRRGKRRTAPVVLAVVGTLLVGGFLLHAEGGEPATGGAPLEAVGSIEASAPSATPTTPPPPPAPPAESGALAPTSPPAREPPSPLTGTSATPPATPPAPTETEPDASPAAIGARPAAQPSPAFAPGPRVASPARAADAGSNCKPPWLIDARGARVFKVECL